MRIQPDSAPPSALRNRDWVRLAAIKISETAQTYVLPAPASISNSEFCSANLLTREQVADGVYRLQLSIEVGLAAELRHGWEGLDAGALEWVKQISGAHPWAPGRTVLTPVPYQSRAASRR